VGIELLTLVLFGTLFFFMAIGTPVAFALGGITVVFTAALWGFDALFNIPAVVFKQMSPVLLAVPLFLLMANMLQGSQVADRLFETIYYWAGPLNGGLAIGTVLICTIFAAMSGISGAATVSMGLLAIPSMLARKYDKRMAVGCVAAGGVLGIVIPPSVIMILYGSVTRVSVGKLFFGGLVPGVIIACLHMTYIGIRCHLRPHMGPAIPLEERIGPREKLIALKAVIAPLCLIIAVLGAVYTGAATPTEAAGIGALGGFICAAIYRRLNWEITLDAIRTTTRITCMALWIVAAASCFNAFYIAMGARELILSLVMEMEVNRWVILAGMQLSIFFLGMIMDDYAIVVLAAPIYAPIAVGLGFDPLWFGILFILNMQMAYLTPPYGFNLFYLKGIVPKGVTMGDIYRSIIPFVGLQALGLILVMIFPQLALWIPSLMVRKL